MSRIKNSSREIKCTFQLNPLLTAIVQAPVRHRHGVTVQHRRYDSKNDTPPIDNVSLVMRPLINCFSHVDLKGQFTQKWQFAHILLMTIQTNPIELMWTVLQRTDKRPWTVAILLLQCWPNVFMVKLIDAMFCFDQLVFDQWEQRLLQKNSEIWRCGVCDLADYAETWKWTWYIVYLS